MMQYALFILGIVCNAAASVFTKRAALFLGARGVDWTSPTRVFSALFAKPDLAFGVVLYGLSFIAYTVVLTRIKLNVAYPIFVSGSIILVTLVSFLFLGEPFHARNLIGIVLIIAGIFVLAVL